MSSYGILFGLFALINIGVLGSWLFSGRSYASNIALMGGDAMDGLCFCSIVRRVTVY